MRSSAGPGAGHQFPVGMLSPPDGQRQDQNLQDKRGRLRQLREISDAVCLCPEECERFFKRMTGITIFQYLLEYRIKKSQELLNNSRLSIAEIAQSSGFTTQSYYSSCFKRLTGCTPGAYRKRKISLITFL